MVNMVVFMMENDNGKMTLNMVVGMMVDMMVNYDGGYDGKL